MAQATFFASGLLVPRLPDLLRCHDDPVATPDAPTNVTPVVASVHVVLLEPP